jgi:nucleoside-diphosphate-sugar epimerase
MGSLSVCVTGASGYVGMHVVEALLAAGHQVRATVRDPADPKKTGPLLKIAEEKPGRLSLHRGELLEAGSFRAALEGAEVLVHVAAVAQLTAKNPQKEIIDPAVEGVRNVLSTAREIGSVRRLVLTSSVAAIGDYSKAAIRPLTAADWNDEATVKNAPYSYGKTAEERLAREVSAAAGWTMTALNPSMVIGPVLAPAHLKASPILIRNILIGKMPLLPMLNLGLVDVRDVAEAHRIAVERPGAVGAPDRHVLCAGNRWLAGMARTLIQEFPDRRMSTREIPNVLVYLNALFDPRMTLAMAWEMVGVVPQYDGAAAEAALGFRYRDIEATIRETGRSMVPFLK